MSELVTIAVPVGTVVYYNQWTAYENRELRGLFKWFTDEEILDLKEGDALWVDVEPHPSGKVYGFAQARVRKIERVGKDVRVSYAGAAASGQWLLLKGQNGKFARCADAKRLAEIVRADGLATTVSPY